MTVIQHLVNSAWLEDLTVMIFNDRVFNTWWILLHFDTYQWQSNQTLGQFFFTMISINEKVI